MRNGGHYGRGWRAAGVLRRGDLDAAALLQRFAEFSPELREEEPTDWERVTREAWPPLCVGERFYLVAPWDEAAVTPAGRLRLEIYPGMACGTGRHPATQLCLQAIERYVRPGARVLDVGSGSGILSDAARLMGAAQVIGCDIDPDDGSHCERARATCRCSLARRMRFDRNGRTWS